MTFEAYENSQQSGRPVELFHFSIGAEDFRYTSAEDVIYFGGYNYIPRQISRNSVKESGDAQGGTLSVELPLADLVCLRYIGIAEPAPMHLLVTRVHRDDLSDARTVWMGRLTSVAYTKNGTLAKMTFLPVKSGLRRQIPHYKYQALCNHVLYGSACQVVSGSFKFTGTASGASTSSITVVGLTASKGAGWATGGKCVVNGDARLILAQPTDVLSLSLPFRDDPDGQAIEVYAGCDHNHTTCDSKFSNAINYGGFPFVPTKNPFQTGVR